MVNSKIKTLQDIQAIKKQRSEGVTFYRDLLFTQIDGFRGEVSGSAKRSVWALAPRAIFFMASTYLKMRYKPWR